MEVYDELKEKYKVLFKKLKVDFTSENLQELKVYDAHLKDEVITSIYTTTLSRKENGSVYEVFVPKKEHIIEIKRARNLKITGTDTAFHAYSESNFKDFTLNTDERIKALKEAEKFCKDFTNLKNPKGLYLYGGYRSGKTYLASCIANELALSFSVNFVFLPDFTRSITFSQNNDISLEERIAILKKCDVLILDDIGAGNRSAWVRDSILLPIIQERLNNKKPIIFTSNYDFEALSEMLSQNKNNETSFADDTASKRLVMRIYEMSKKVKLSEKYQK